ncbi:P-selectin-like [Mobula birostris]|uniref:P-selectin-like n=1 Tax=Mobula birostris TaxID=1983395 RepID=UPI003B28D713
MKCDHPPTISNGTVTEGEEWLYGAEASYLCDEGYTLTGQETIYCTDTGHWSHPPPICTVRKCDHPPTISHGTVTEGEEWLYGYMANYSCDEGHSLTGQETIRCTGTGAWSHPPPNCTVMKCDHPPTISNGTVTEGEEWLYGAEASYLCDEGYTLTGQETIYCTDTGHWSHPPPICTVRKCDHPPTISHGTVTEGEEWLYGYMANYSCDEGHSLTGQETIRCTGTGAWSHPPPNCTVMKCDHPPTISNGTVTEGEEWLYGAEASICATRAIP